MFCMLASYHPYLHPLSSVSLCYMYLLVVIADQCTEKPGEDTKKVGYAASAHPTLSKKS